ncbi:MAG: hypothetical protein HY922_02170 [Elusimicrobia bacterium]|nr:hypothetical protein [Elusimicrobiota bacterium]
MVRIAIYPKVYTLFNIVARGLKSGESETEVRLGKSEAANEKATIALPKVNARLRKFLSEPKIIRRWAHIIGEHDADPLVEARWV